MCFDDLTGLSDLTSCMFSQEERRARPDPSAPPVPAFTEPLEYSSRAEDNSARKGGPSYVASAPTAQEQSKAPIYLPLPPPRAPQTTSYAPIPSSSSSSYGPLAAPYVPPSSYAPSSSSYGPSSSSYPGSSSYTPQSSGYGSGPPPSFGPTSVSSSYGPIASSSAYAQSLSATPYQPSYSDNSQANSYPSSSSSYEQQQQQHSSYGDFAPSAPTPHQHSHSQAPPSPFPMPLFSPLSLSLPFSRLSYILVVL